MDDKSIRATIDAITDKSRAGADGKKVSLAELGFGAARVAAFVALPRPRALQLPQAL